MINLFHRTCIQSNRRIYRERCVKNRILYFSTKIKVIDFSSYVDQMIEILKPPVSNALMFSGTQLKIMLVKGPNQRTDYHLNLGEELFYQYKGAIDVDIKEPEINLHKTIHIPTDHMFLLSNAMPHSPQRYDDTVGIVFERARNSDEMDGMRWYTSSNQILYEKYFYCTDLGTQIKEAIEEYHQSNAYKLLIPQKDHEKPVKYKQYSESFKQKRGLQPILHSPFSLSSLLSPTSLIQNTKTVIDSEFMVKLFSDEMKDTILIHEQVGDTFLWQKMGESKITVMNHIRKSVDQIIHLKEGSMCLITTTKEQDIITQSSSTSRLLLVRNDAANVLQ